MSHQQTKTNTCGCCEGVKSLTPLPVHNRPGLADLTYRVGTHGSFKASLIAALSHSAPLQRLTTRDDDDPAIALCDACATVLDVLTFYQERIANEGYLRTARERRSILELARSIGYELNPGVAAGTCLAFTVEDVEDSPQVVNLPAGIKAQSLPGQDETPQIFETVEAIEARPRWNALRPRRNTPQVIDRHTRQLYLQGTDHQVQPGDAILMVGEERERWSGSENWDLRILTDVTINRKNDTTLIAWKENLGHQNPSVDPAKNPKIYVFRQRAALFGFNAPDVRAMPENIKTSYESEIKDSEWIKQPLPSDIVDLDSLYPDIIEGSWIALMKPTYIELYKAIDITIVSRRDYTLTSQVTRIKLDTTENLSGFGLRDTVVLARSEALPLAEQPLSAPVFGKSVPLNGVDDQLQPGQALSLSGMPLRRVRVVDTSRIVKDAGGEITGSGPPLEFFFEDQTGHTALKPGEVLTLAGPPVAAAQEEIRWHLRDQNSRAGFVTAAFGQLMPLPPEENIEPVSELIFIDNIRQTGGFSELILAKSLQHVYHRDTVVINANVARATHGETRDEVLGSGDGSKSFQAFELDRVPLTYVSAPTPAGSASTLEVRVNGVRWEEVPTFYRLPPDARAYITRMRNDGTVVVKFSDGTTGARLPGGRENVTATYRSGTGFDGLVRAGQISELMSRPLGLEKVINPLPPAGAGNPETLSRARRNAPLTVLTLDRIVSLSDYEDFARAFPGIGKARAVSGWAGESRAVHLTIAPASGETVPADSDLYKNLKTALDNYSDANQAVFMDSFELLKFNLEANLLIDKDYLEEEVRQAAVSALRAYYSFEERALAQSVSAAEILSLIQKIAGVSAVDLDYLYPAGHSPELAVRLLARDARWNETSQKTLPAQLLVINDDGIKLHARRALS